MLKRVNDDIIADFFISSRFRIYRHLLLIFSIAAITITFIWYTSNHSLSYYEKIGIWFIYIIVFAIAIYMNVFLFVPRLLFRNNLTFYFFCLILTVFFVLISVLFIQKYIVKQVMVPSPEFNYVALLKISSVSVILGFMLAGTTTVLLLKHFISNNQQIDELESATLQSELKLLKNQINPHFLFNMLNNANVLLERDGEEASRVILKLEDLLRYQINDCSKDKVLLSSEINFLNDFLNLEKIRRDRFEYTLFKEGNIERVEIFSLLLIIFVENAIKHNSDSENLSYVYLSFKVDGNKFEFKCENSKPTIKDSNHKTGGLGLKNIKRRLELLYPHRHILNIKDERTKYTVKLELIL